MKVKLGTKWQLFTLVILSAFIYINWTEITIGALYVYKLTGSPHADRALGEVYSTRAYKFNQKAALHFQNALYGYKMALPLATPDQRKWIEFIIGSHYECGRGVEPNLQAAKYWYQQSAKKGLVLGQELLKQINQALEKADHP